MSSTLRTYLVHAPDLANALERRLAVRHLHLAETQIAWKEGRFVSGGAILSEHPSHSNPSAGPPPIIGSQLVIKADSLESARKMVEADQYWKNDVWDKEKLTIQPMMTFDPATFKP